MTFSLDLVQDDVIALLDGAFAQPLYEMAIPDPDTVLRNKAGDIDPYLSYQFRVPYEGVAHSMIGPRGDDYNLVIQIQTIAPQAIIARKLANKVVDTMIGAHFTWSGPIRATLGGPTIGIVSSNSATEAYTVPLAFRIPIQLQTIPDAP